MHYWCLNAINLLTIGILLQFFSLWKVNQGTLFADTTNPYAPGTIVTDTNIESHCTLLAYGENLRRLDQEIAEVLGTFPRFNQLIDVHTSKYQKDKSNNVITIRTILVSSLNGHVHTSITNELMRSIRELTSLTKKVYEEAAGNLSTPNSLYCTLSNCWRIFKYAAPISILTDLALSALFQPLVDSTYLGGAALIFGTALGAWAVNGNQDQKAMPGNEIVNLTSHKEALELAKSAIFTNQDVHIILLTTQSPQG